MVSTRMAEDVGRVLGGRYRLISPIGAGASARVYLADDVTLRRRVAVKILHEGLADDEQFLRRFRAEAQAAAAVNHANLLAVYDWGDDDRGPFLVTEYLAGGSLRAMLDTETLLTPSQALVVGLDAARGLDHAHRRGLVHRDVKPANLLFDEEGTLRVADFGVARALAEAAWTEPQGVLVGSARYASPEQAGGRSVDGRADVYALALVLIEAVTGSVPFAGEDPLAVLMARVDRPLPVPDEVGPLRPVLEHAGALDPAERLDAAALGQALYDLGPTLPQPRPLVLAGTPEAVSAAPPADPTLHHGDAASVPPAAPPVAPVAPDRRRRRWPLFLGLAVALAIVAATFWFVTNELLATHVVPNVVDQTEEQALDVLGDAAFDWDLDVVRQYDDDTIAGTVMRLDPVPGERLREGGTLHVYVSRGPTPVAVPGLEGLTAEDAGEALGTASLDVGDISRTYDEEVGEGLVISWSFEGEERPTNVPRGGAVDLVVSDGPSPRSVPEVAGLDWNDARRLLREADLAPERENVFSSDVEPGKVVGTDPAVGSEVAKDGTVMVRVSKGPDIVSVPDVDGLSLEEATARIEAAGLVVSDVEGNPSRSVWGTEPKAGERVARGSGVVVVMRGFFGFG